MRGRSGSPSERPSNNTPRYAEGTIIRCRSLSSNDNLTGTGGFTNLSLPHRPGPSRRLKIHKVTISALRVRVRTLPRRLRPSPYAVGDRWPSSGVSEQ
jgi:hypothetical protein